MSKEPFTHLTPSEKYQIQALYKSGKSSDAIGEQLGRCGSTIRRELHRGRKTNSKRYNPDVSMRRYAKSRKQSGVSRIKVTGDVWLYVLDGLKLGWSPDQIRGRYALEHGQKIGVLSIYTAIQRHKHYHTLKQYLRHGGKRYKAPKIGSSVGVIKNRVDIDQRPKEADDKLIIGHWEADTIIGKDHKGAAVTLVDKASRFTFIMPASRKTADICKTAIIAALKDVADQVLTITYDNGCEFAHHEKVNDALDCQSYFAKPYHSWERGLNEHTNGLIRQYLPKKTNLSTLTKKQCRTIQNLLNNRPRKCLNYKTPAEVFLQQN